MSAVEPADMVVYGDRRQVLPAPPHVVWDDLVAPRLQGARVWLQLDERETWPRVIDSRRPDTVTWTSLWLERPDDVVVIDLDDAGGETGVRVRLLAAGHPPDAGLTGHIRYRISKLLFGELRYTYGQ